MLATDYISALTSRRGGAVRARGSPSGPAGPIRALFSWAWYRRQTWPGRRPGGTFRVPRAGTCVCQPRAAKRRHVLAVLRAHASALEGLRREAEHGAPVIAHCRDARRVLREIPPRLADRLQKRLGRVDPTCVVSARTRGGARTPGWRHGARRHARCEPARAPLWCTQRGTRARRNSHHGRGAATPSAARRSLGT